MSKKLSTTNLIEEVDPNENSDISSVTTSSASSTPSKGPSSESTIDLVDLVERIKCDQLALHEIADKDLILFLGTTNAGKTTTLCFLAEKDLRVKAEIIHDPFGEEIIGNEVIDTVTSDTEFRIGHTCDSTTSSIHICHLPHSSVILADSCGFQDTQGSTIDIANAVILRSAMGLCASLRPVIVIDANVIGVDKGVPFVQLLSLLMRFFSPVEQYLSSMTFLFTHGGSETNSASIGRNLARIASATHVSKDEEMKKIVNYVFAYVKKAGDRCLLKASEMATPDPQSQIVVSRRHDLRNLIEGNPPIPKSVLCSLGCPISAEAQSALREKCQELKISILYHLSNDNFPPILQALDQLSILTEVINLDFVSVYLNDCSVQLDKEIHLLYSEFDKQMKENRFEELSKTMKRCFDSRALERYLPFVKQEYRSRVQAINRKLVELSCKILTDDLKEFNHVDIECLRNLREIDGRLSYYLTDDTKRSSGLDAAMKHMEYKVNCVDSRCTSLLNLLHKMLSTPSDSDTQDSIEDSSLFEGLHAHAEFAPPAFAINSDCPISQPLHAILLDMAFLKSCSLFSEFLAPKYLTCYAQRLNQLREILEIGQKHMVAYVERIRIAQWNDALSHQFGRIHFLLKTLYSYGVNDLVDCHLYDMPLLVVEETLKLASDHLTTIDNCLLQRQYPAIVSPLKVCLSIQLRDDSFENFKANFVQKKVLLLKDSIQSVYREAISFFSKFQSCDDIERAEYDSAMKLLLLQDASQQLDFLYSDAISFGPTTWYNHLLSLAKSDWANRVAQFAEEFRSFREPGVNTTFARIENMTTLCEVFSKCREDVQEVSQNFEACLFHIINQNYRDSSYVNDILLTDLRHCDTLIRLGTQFSSSKLLGLQYQDVGGWATQVVSQLNKWKSAAIAHLHDQIEFASTNSREALRSKNGASLNQHLDLLQHHCRFDHYLQPSASTCYQATLTYLAAELNSLGTSAKNALSRGDLEKYNSIRLFLESSSIYGHHFAGIDFCSMVTSMFQDHRQVLDRIPEEVRHYLEAQRFQNIRGKLVSVREDDPEIFDECDMILTRYFRKLSEAILSANNYTSNDRDTLAVLLRHLETIQDAVVLSGVSTYNPLNLLNTILNTLDQQFNSVKKRFLISLSTYKFVQASDLLDALFRFTMFDSSLSDLKSYLPPTYEYFSIRVDKTVEENILALTSKLLNDCYFFLGITNDDSPHLESKMDEGSVLSQDIKVDITNIAKLSKAISEACESILFRELVDFSDLRYQVSTNLIEKLQYLIVQIQASISNLQIDHSESLLRMTQMLYDTSHKLLEPFQAMEISRQLERQQKACASARNQVQQPKSLNFDEEGIHAMVTELRVVKGRDYTDYTNMLNSYSEKVFQECEKWKNVMDADRLIIPASQLKHLFKFISLVPTLQQCFLFHPSGYNIPDRCADILVAFDIFLKEYVEQAEDHILEERSVANIHKNLVDLVQICSELSLSHVEALPQWLAKVNALINEGAQILEKIELGQQTLTSFNLFSCDNCESILNDLELLSRQNEATPTPQLGRRRKSSRNNEGTLAISVERLRGQIFSAKEKFCNFMSNQEYESAARGYRNSKSLGSFSPLTHECTVLLEEFNGIVGDFKKFLLEALKSVFQLEHFKEVDKLITQAAAFDKYFSSALDGLMDPLMDEIVSLFRTQLKAIIDRANQATDLDDHVYNILLIKTLVYDISSKSIQALAESYIDDYLKRVKGIDFFKFGMKLMEVGPLGEEVAEQYPQFKSVLTKRFNEATASISIEHALTALKSLNPSLKDSELTQLREIYDQYHGHYEKNLQQYLRGYQNFQVRKLSDLSQIIKRKANTIITSPTKSDYVEVLAGIFALWTILSSKEQFGESNDRSCLIRPHAIQLVAIFRLLTLDSVHDGWTKTFSSYLGHSMYGHLIQVGTGEGKSVLLGGLAALLALFGTEVSCASYSKHLSRRDYEAFQPLFDHLGVSSMIHYSTLAGLAETVINYKGDIRAATKNYLTSSQSTRSIYKKPHDKILLIDEVDVFFSPDFFGRTYNPVACFSYPETVALFQFVWQHRQSGITLQSIQNLPEYQSLRSKLIPEAIPLLDQHIGYMIDDSICFQQPAYEVVTLDDGNKRIGYKDQDSVNCSLHFGYRTAFAYLHELSRHPSLATHLDEVLSLQIPCGCYSYAEIPKKAFKCILGVTGTLSSLSPTERNVISKEYSLDHYTIMPSMYGDSKLAFKKNGDVIMEIDTIRYYQTILKEIQDERAKGRPVILYFDTEESLMNFRNSEYGQRLGEVNIVTEKTENIPFYVNKATVAKTVTLFTRIFGRGLDFISRDVDVDNAGGIHVIQTFFSEYLSEEIQIRGRTARQAKKGSFKMILLSTDLEKFGLSGDELNQHYQSNTFYEILDTKRNEEIAKNVAVLVDEAAKAATKNITSYKFRKMIFGTNGSPQEVVNFITSFQQWKGTGQALHSVFCLDESGSMLSSWQGLLQALREFLSIRQDKGGVNDLVSIIQFNDRSRVVLNSVPLRDALTAVTSLQCQGGGTSFAPALNMADEVLNSQTNLDSVLIFMTDGQCSDPVPAVQACQRISQNKAGHLQFFGVAFNTTAETLRSMTDSAAGTMVAANDVKDLRDSFQNIARVVSANHR